MDELSILLEQANNLADLNDSQLAELRDNLGNEARNVAAAGDLTDEVLAALQQARTAVEAITSTLAEHAADADRRATEAQAALDAIDAATAEAPDPEPAAEPEPTPEPEPATPEVTTTTETTTTTPVEPEADVVAPLPVAAAAAVAPRVGRVAARRPAVAAPRAPLTAAELPDTGTWGLVASSNSQAFRAGEPLNDAEKVSRAVLEQIEASLGYTGVGRNKVKVARVGRDASRMYDGDRYLDGNVTDNERKIGAVGRQLAAAARLHPAGTQQALAASGGICAPQSVRYDQPVIGSDARPFRDGAMVRFGADRGGISTLPPPRIDELVGSVDTWTEANDLSPGSDGAATKPCLVVTCPAEVTDVVQAITRCLRFGTFRARYWAEQIDAWVRLSMVQWARLAETELITAVAAGSTTISTGQLLGATRDVLAGLDRTLAQFTSYYRAPGTRMTWAAPFWLRNMIRTDLAREMPGATDERLATADATIESFFAVRDINPTWIVDGEAGQVFHEQLDGPAIGYPSTVVTYLYPQGSWLFGDGGTLDLGLIRDSNLIGTNDVLMFAESMELAHFHGTDSRRITFDLCPDGTTSGTSDIDPCTTGS